jgi:hypothetical protein
MQAAAKYAKCRLGADKKAELNAEPADYTKCDERQAIGWAKIETKYGAQCPTSGDQSSVQSDVAAMTACLAGNFSTTGEQVDTQVNCVACPVDGVVVNNACWILSVPGDSCNAACALKGMLYDNQTETFAGAASGTLGHCAFILDELGAPQEYAAYDFGSGIPDIGCAAFAQRIVGATATAQGNATNYQRACACQ